MASSSARIGSQSSLPPYYRAKIRTTARAGLRAAPRSALHPETRATSHSDLRVERWTGLRAGLRAVQHPVPGSPCEEENGAVTILDSTHDLGNEMATSHQECSDPQRAAGWVTVWAELRSDPCAGLWANGWSSQPAADRQKCDCPAD